MGPSLPDFLCVFSADNGVRQHTNRRPRGGWGAVGGGAWPSGGRGGGPVPLGLWSLTLKQPDARLWTATARCDPGTWLVPCVTEDMVGARALLAPWSTRATFV